MSHNNANGKIAIILAAGIGSRLKPETCSRPKCLVEVLGKPILEYQLTALESTSVRDIVIVSGYKSHEIERYIKKRKNRKNVTIIINDNYECTNNMYSLFLALSSIDLKEYDYYFVINGDVVIEPKIAKALDNVNISTIAVDTSLYLDESMKVTIVNGKITNISKNIPIKESNGVSIDFYGFRQTDMMKLFEVIKRQYIDKNDLGKWTEVAIQKALQDDVLVMVPKDITGLIWWEIDNEIDLKRAEYRLKLLNSLEHLKRVKLYAFDIDGTLILGNIKIDGSSELIKYLMATRKKVYFITNNSSMSNISHAERLSKILNVDIPVSCIFSSLDYIGKEINKVGKIKVYPLLPRESIEYLAEKYSVNFTEEHPDVVLVGFDTELTYEKLKKACLFIESGSRFWLIHPDIKCPIDGGFIPDAGSIGKIIELVTNKIPELVGGKPNPKMLTESIRENETQPSETCYVCDRLETDVKMALKSGILPILFLTGDTSFEMIWNLDSLMERILLGENPKFFKSFLEKHLGV